MTEYPTDASVQLVPHDPGWADRARQEGQVIGDALGRNLLQLHHIGSTAIPGIRAKPVLDLLPVIADLGSLDRSQSTIEALGYQWRGEYGLPGRRYCAKDDAVTGARLVQLHCYELGSPEIVRHLAFRDFLRSNPELAQAYEREKLRCQALCPDDNGDYTDCKDAWIRRIETVALKRWTGQIDQ